MRAVILVIVLTAGLLVATGVVMAQTGYTLAAFTVNAGGTASGAGYSVAGTLGQSQPSLVTGSGFEVRSGFWSTASHVDAEEMYLPFVSR